MVINITPGELIHLGKTGENKAVTIVFDAAHILRDFGKGGTFVLINRRAGDEGGYPAEVTTDGDKVKWTVTALDNAEPGRGECELQYIRNDVIVKSITWQTRVEGSILAGTEKPDWEQEWPNKLLGMAARAEQAAGASAAKAAEAQGSAVTAERAASEARSIADGKQDRIADLETIRSNAAAVAGKQDRIADLETIRSNAAAVAGKQDKLIQGENITIEGNVISASGGESYDDTELRERIGTIEQKEPTWNSKQDKLIAGANITIEDNVISAKGGGSSYDDGPIKERIGAVETRVGTAESDIDSAEERISAIEDKEAGWDSKQDALTAGDGIDISGNVVKSKIINTASVSAMVTKNSATAWGAEIWDEQTVAVHEQGDTFAVTAMVPGAQSYQWMYSRDGTTWSDSGAATAKEATLETSLTSNARRWYKCRVTTGNGTVDTAVVDIMRGDTIATSLKGAVESLIDRKLGLIEQLASSINEVIG